MTNKKQCDYLKLYIYKGELDMYDYQCFDDVKYYLLLFILYDYYHAQQHINSNDINSTSSNYSQKLAYGFN